MSERFYDFDAARAETLAEPLVVRAFGEDIELPPECPARLMLTLDDIDAITSQQFLDALQDVFGEDRVRRWLSSGESLEAIGQLFGSVMLLYQGVDPGEAKALIELAMRAPRKPKPAKRTNAKAKASKAKARKR